MGTAKPVATVKGGSKNPNHQPYGPVYRVTYVPCDPITPSRSSTSTLLALVR